MNKLLLALFVLTSNGVSLFAETMVDVKVRPTDKDWTPRASRSVSELPGFSPQDVLPARDLYGGDASRKERATGFFRTQKIGDRWCLIDPDGGRFFAMAMNSVSPGRGPNARKAFAEKFGSENKWAVETINLLRDEGFNTIGNWSAVAPLRATPKPMPYCVTGNFLSEYAKSKKTASQGTGHTAFKSNCMPVFNPDFSAFCDAYAKKLVTSPTDPFLLGYFSDNELPPADLAKFLALDSNDGDLADSYRAAREWFGQRRGKDAPASDITPEDKDAFMGYVFDRYFALTSAAIRRYDSHHLLIGSRFHSAEKNSPATFAAAGKYLDVISVNLYGVWSPVRESVERWTLWSNRPVMITEWYAKAMDAGLPNLRGAGWTVKTQRERGLFYETFCLGLLETSNCVGWHWFKYQDNDPADTSTDPSNRDANKGIVDKDFSPYEPLLDSMKILNNNVYRLLSHP